MKLNNRIFLMLGIASVFSLNNFAAMCVTYNDCTQPSNEGTYCQRRGFNHKKCPVGCYCQGHSKSAIGDDLHNALANICLNKNPTWPQQQKMASANISLCPADRPYSDNGISNSSECSLNSIISYDASTYSYVPSSSGLGQYCSYEKNSCTVSCPAGCYCTGSKYSAVQTSDFLNNICNGTTSPNSDTTTILNNAGIHTCPAGYRKGGTGAKAITECQNASGVSYTPSNNNNNSNSFTKPGYTVPGSFTVVSGGSSGGGTGYQQLNLPGGFQQKTPNEIGGTVTPTTTQYTVTYSCGDGFGITGQNYTQTVVNGLVTTLPASVCIAPDGKTFDFWQCGGKEKNANSSITVIANTTCIAQYKDAGHDEVECTVSYYCSNAMGRPAKEVVISEKLFTVESGAICSPQSNTQVFDVWEDDDGNKVAPDSTYQCKGSDIIFTAQWRGQTPNDITCSPTQYLPQNKAVCEDCLAGNKCPGGTFPKNPSEDKGKLPCEGANEYSGSRAAQCSQCEDGYHANDQHTGCEPDNNGHGNIVEVVVPKGSYVPSRSHDDGSHTNKCRNLVASGAIEDYEFCPGGKFTIDLDTDYEDQGIYTCAAKGTHTDDFEACKVQLSKDKLEHGILGERECWLAETADEYKDCVFYGARDVKPNN